MAFEQPGPVFPNHTSVIIFYCPTVIIHNNNDNNDNIGIQIMIKVTDQSSKEGQWTKKASGK